MRVLWRFFVFVVDEILNVAGGQPVKPDMTDSSIGSGLKLIESRGG